MTNINKLKSDIEDDARAVPADSEPMHIAEAVLHEGVGAIPLRRVRGNFYEPVPIRGAWMRSPWDVPAKTVKDVRRDFAKAEADAVGIVLPNGAQYVIDPSTRRLVRFTQYVNGTTHR